MATELPNLVKMAEEAQALFVQQQSEIEAVKKGLDLRSGRIKKAEKDVAEREKQLTEWEAALNRKYDEVSRIENAKLLEMKTAQQESSAELKLAEANQKLKKAEEALAEVKQREAEVLEREKAATEREKDMRSRIEAEFAQKLVKGLSGGR